LRDSRPGIWVGERDLLLAGGPICGSDAAKPFSVCSSVSALRVSALAHELVETEHDGQYIAPLAAHFVDVSFWIKRTGIITATD